MSSLSRKVQSSSSNYAFRAFTKFFSLPILTTLMAICLQPVICDNIHPLFASPYRFAQCDLNSNEVVNYLLEQMRQSLTTQNIKLDQGSIQLYRARFSHIGEMVRLEDSCAQKLNHFGSKLIIPAEIEIRNAQIQSKVVYNLLWDFNGQYEANFRYIRMRVTLEADADRSKMTVQDLKITSKDIISDSVVFGSGVNWIFRFVRNFFDTNNQKLYEQIAQQILQKEIDHFDRYDMINKIGRIAPRDDQHSPDLWSYISKK